MLIEVCTLAVDILIKPQCAGNQTILKLSLDYTVHEAKTVA